MTAALLACSTAAVWLCTFRKGASIVLIDAVFAVLATAIAISIAKNGRTADPREYALLILTLAAYPAARFVCGQDFVAGRTAFIAAQGALAVVGTVVSGWALIGQWDSDHGKPVIFGFDGAAIFFLQALSFVLFAIVALDEKPRTSRRLAIGALLVLPIAVFSASLVRFTFVALVVSLIAAAWFGGGRRRVGALAVVGVVIFGIGIGLLARSTHAVAQYAQYAMGEASTDQTRVATSAAPALRDATDMPSCSMKVNANNSIAIRKALLADAMAMLPGAGLFGHGLDSFMQRSCVRDTEVHNSVLQGAIEFGWLGGVAMATLIALALAMLAATANHDPASRFLFCCLLFVSLLSMAHGRASREAALFAFIGCAVGVSRSARGGAPAK